MILCCRAHGRARGLGLPGFCLPGATTGQWSGGIILLSGVPVSLCATTEEYRRGHDPDHDPGVAPCPSMVRSLGGSNGWGFPSCGNLILLIDKILKKSILRLRSADLGFGLSNLVGANLENLKANHKRID